MSSQYGSGAAGSVIVGSADGECVLASRKVSDPDYVVFTQSGNAFSSPGGGPGDEFESYAASIGSVNVVLQATGKIKPA